MITARSRRLVILFLLHAVKNGAVAFTTNSQYKSILPRLHHVPVHIDSYAAEDELNRFELRMKKKRKSDKASNFNLNGARSKGFQNANSFNEFKEGTMDTALCIIPPDKAWDDIQRARHFAKDPSFYTWPPAIRLFHPFVDRLSVTEVATSIAEVVEKYDLESFEITIDKLLIVPHFEHLQEHEEARKQLPDQAEIVEDVPSEDEERVQALIQSEEIKGKQKLAKRKAKERAIRNERKENGMGSENEESGNDEIKGKSSSQSPKDILKDQRKSMAEFNGPCVLCLEPNEESKIHIQAFREILRKKLFENYNPFSVSSTVTNPNTLKNGLPRVILKQHGLIGSDSGTTHKPKKNNSSTFRPTIPLGRFSTVTKASEIANRLQQVWEPLIFRVCDLHVVSTLESSSLQTITNDEEEGYSVSSDPYSIEVDESGTPSLHENRELTLRKFHGSDGGESILSTKGEYGCDAMIMLKGEEDQLLRKTETTEESDEHEFEDDLDGVEESSSFYMDDEEEERIMALLLSPAAIPGGQGQDKGKHVSKASGIDERETNLQSWLEEDEDIDDGATIIIGRTQFFMGEMRQYAGMPASSTMDGKDRVMGDEVSGSARRRGAVHRQGDRWLEGDYGRKEKDYLP